MSLTKDDLQAIKQVVQSTVQPLIEDAKEDIKIDVAAAFVEVHEKIEKVNIGLDGKINNIAVKLDEVKDVVHRTERVQRAEITRADEPAEIISKLQKKFA